MARRKRKHLSRLQLLAAALAELLPPPMQASLRERRVPALAVVRMFTPDHIHLHALGGSDDWHNIHMRLRGPDVLIKNAMDTSVVAKVRRIAAKHEDFRRRVLAPIKRRRARPARRRFTPTPVKVIG